MSTPSPIIPSDKLVIIAVRQRRVQVSRYRQTGRFTYELETAANWKALEAEAVRAVEDMIGAIVENADYPCPPGLAAKARWQ
jgi:hypothetical protein